jgi:KUP system potassium uptake protein
LATAATVIASQALISGTYSVTMQAVQLGFLPRLQITHTSSTARGQIYMPYVNWTLMAACVGLVVGFRSSSNLAAAYGIAVSLDMAITSFLFFFAASKIFGWSVPWAGALCGAFLGLELVFCAANFPKIAHGGWFPLVVAASLFTLMSTWHVGRRLLRQRLEGALLPVDSFLDSIRRKPPQRVPGTAVFMAANPNGISLALLHNLKHNKILHDRVLLLNIQIAQIPHVKPADRLRVEPLEAGFYRVQGEYGFMDKPNVPELLRQCEQHDLAIDPAQTTYFLSRETVIPTRKPGLAAWRKRVFGLLTRNAQTATAFFQLPANRVVELGMQIEL